MATNLAKNAQTDECFPIFALIMRPMGEQVCLLEHHLLKKFPNHQLKSDQAGLREVGPVSKNSGSGFVLIHISFVIVSSIVRLCVFVVHQAVDVFRVNGHAVILFFIGRA